MSGHLFFELIGPLVFLAFAVGFAAVRLHVGHLVSAGYFALSYLLRSCGFMADYLRPSLPPDLAIYAVGVPFILAGLTFCAGVFHLYKVRPPVRTLATIGISLLGAVTWYRYVDDSLFMRIVVLNGASAAVLTWLAVALHRRMTRRVDRFLQLLLLLNALQFVVRTAVMLSLEGAVLTAENYAHSLTAASLRFSIIVATVAIAGSLFAIYCMEIVSGLTRSSQTDPLTGILNRRGFEVRFQGPRRELVPGGTPHGFIFADIDAFKSVNDRHGHNVGDTVIAQIAQLLQGTAREGDLVARWGGEEFVILIAHGGERLARLYAEAVRSVAENMEHACLEGESVTISFGVTEWRHGDSLRDVCKRADDALYEAKQAGRNCVRSALQAKPRRPAVDLATAIGPRSGFSPAQRGSEYKATG